MFSPYLQLKNEWSFTREQPAFIVLRKDSLGSFAVASSSIRSLQEPKHVYKIGTGTGGVTYKQTLGSPAEKSLAGPTVEKNNGLIRPEHLLHFRCSACN